MSGERRGVPRSETRFMVRKIHHEDQELRSVFCETRNISRNGAYCLCTQPFPEFARIRITLELQMPDSDEKEDLDCEGVVVRADGKTEVSGQEMYGFAVFFDRMSEENREKIEDYVKQHRVVEKESDDQES